MTERLRANPYATHHQGDARRASVSEDEGLSARKTMVVLVVVVGCFAVLWPKLFYPMLVNNANSQMKPGPVDKTTGCCDVISELDLDTIKIMSELCSTIIDTTGETPPGPKEILTKCRKAVLETCGIDISAVLQDRIVSLGHSVKQISEEVRSLNGSLCLKYNFGLSPWILGVPHRVNINLDPLNSIRQERSSNLRPEMVHPAFKERGRAIPQPEPSGLPRRTPPPPKIVEGRPGPIPGMRPAMGGHGHVVPPPKHSNYGFMGVLMPLYTIGFALFFIYTVMKLLFKKKEIHVGAPLYPPCESEERFHKEVFEANRNYFHRPNRDSSKIVVNAVSALLEEVNQELEKRKVKTPETVHEQDEIKANGSLPKEDEQGTVKVMGMETRASSESGKKWSRPDSPVLPHPQPVAPKEPSPPPQKIFLEGSLPPQSQILVAESATEAQKDPEDDSPVVLAGKMTLSVISLDSETGTEDSTNSSRKAEASDEERRTSSSNVSEEFEKINAADLEDQINSIIEEAENMTLTEENRYSLSEELDKYTEEIIKAPQINEKDKDDDVLEEIKNQLNLEDDLLLALKENEPEGKISLPVTDIIKEFLSNEENALLAETKEIKVNDLTIDEIDTLERYRRSLDEEKEDEELELNEDLKDGDEILEIVNKEVENSIVSEKDLAQQDILVEKLPDQESIKDQLDEELQNIDVKIGDDSTPVLRESKEEGVSLEQETLTIDVDDPRSKEEHKVLSKDTEEPYSQDNLSVDNELIRELSQKLEETVISENEEIKISSEQSDFEKEIVHELVQKSDEKTTSLENEELKVAKEIDSEKVHQTFVLDDDVSRKSEEAESLENEDLKASKEIDSERTQQNLVSANKVISPLSQETKDEPVSLANKDLKESEKELDSLEIQQKLVSEDDKNENTFNQKREKSPENKADLLLQGLMVKEVDFSDQKGIKDDLSKITYKNEVELTNIETVVEKDSIDVDKREQQPIERKEDILLQTEEEESSVQSDEVSPLEAEDSKESNQKTKVEQNLIVEEGSSTIVDEEGLIDDEDYDDSEDEELINDEVRDINREVYEDRGESVERRVNGEDFDSSRNGGTNSETAAENEISEEEDLDDEDDDADEIEEIIEYVDNTDDEGEEIVEVNGNEHHLNENGPN